MELCRARLNLLVAFLFAQSATEALGALADYKQNMVYKTIYTKKIKDAIKFSIKTHELDQKQKRKGKDVAYITHPLTVGLILAHAGASDEVIAAGILHDTIEDSVMEKKVSKEILAERFGEPVAQLVLSVTEGDKSLVWSERKKEALAQIKTFSHESLLVKSADVLSNVSEILEDHNEIGDEVFVRFGAPKEKILRHYLELIRTIVKGWSDNPLAFELTFLAGQLQTIGAPFFMLNFQAPVIEYQDYDRSKPLDCPVCGWHGLAEANTDSHSALDVTCPICEKMLLIAKYS